jgi:hypothetical protein
LEVVHAVMDIVENVLQSVYLLDTVAKTSRVQRLLERGLSRSCSSLQLPIMLLCKDEPKTATHDNVLAKKR